uniref:Uncharacterized protein n=1 Tax=Anguilla anguilla TaxID=7936 RepID=A0A0E9VNM4_ANGAN
MIFKSTSNLVMPLKLNLAVLLPCSKPQSDSSV